jgi:hypothetical protein
VSDPIHRTGWDRCLSIEDFRAHFWLVKASADEAA